jgi:N-methylhydantoinase B
MSERKPQNPAALDPVTLAVLKGRLEQVADEMDATLYRSAFNPIIAEAHDACHGIYDGVSGDTLVQGKSGLPVFVGAMAFAVRAAAKAAATRGGMQDGDIWLFNDPYEGGTHANDFKLVRPFFRNGQLFCFLASAAHWHDVGGAVPGNYNPAATECWQEAVQIPPVRILRAGVLDEDVLAILRANTRLPDSLWGDLNGQLAALELGAKRLNGLLDEYGDAKVAQAMVELRSRAVRLMRSHISSLPDGCYSFEDVLDNDGVVDTPLTIALDMTVKGDRLMLRRALSNVLSNAIRHTPDGQTVSVQLDGDGAEGQVRVSVTNPGETIAPEHLPHLFERFYRADPSRQHHGDGAGLGLAIVKSIMDLHGGTITVQSTAGQTCFEMTLNG